MANNQNSCLLLWLEPHHLSSLPLSPLKKKKNQNKKKAHPFKKIYIRLCCLLFNPSIWELIFHTTEQQMQLSFVVRWSEAMERKIFTLEGIFTKYVLACTQLLRYKNRYTNQTFLKHVWTGKKTHLERNKKKMKMLLSQVTV